MLINDKEIIQIFRNSEVAKIEPFYNTLQTDKISFGLSSAGYDLRLSEVDFYIFENESLWKSFISLIKDPLNFWRNFKQQWLAPIDPKNTSKDRLKKLQSSVDESGVFFVIPGNSYALGVSEEYVQMPPDVLGVCLGKSTYARVGVVANITPIEPGWYGYITLEFSNSSKKPVKVYAGEGVCQLLFFKIEPPDKTYGNRKYQNQKKEVTAARLRE